MKYKKLTVSLCFGLIFAIIFSVARFDASCEDVRQNILRLHIVANSDSAKDQEIKIKVRDALLNDSKDVFNNTVNLNDAVKKAENSIEKFKETACKTLKENGFDYGVEISVGEADFNTREYNKFTLPAGKYKAVRVVLGNGKGKNWWCVMFPSLCVSTAEEHNLRESVNEDSAKICESKSDYKIRFKIVEIYEGIKAKISQDTVYKK